MEQSLHQIIQELPAEFVTKVTECTNVGELQKMKKTASEKEILLIEARISRINFLVI